MFYAKRHGVFYTPTCAYSSKEAVGRVSSDGTHIVSYHPHDTVREFIWTDVYTNNCLKFNLPQNMHIEDFELLNDTIYFCGYDNAGAIVGYFTESMFYSSYINLKYATITETQKLTKMEVYSDPLTHRHVVAAIGFEPTGNNFINTGLFIVKFGGTIVNYDYQFVSGDMDTRKFIDIAVTPQKIVTVGIFDFFNNIIDITVTDKTNTTQFDVNFYTENAGQFNSNIYSIEYLKDEEVAISSLLASNAMPSTYISPVHIFDATTINFMNSQIIPLNEKSASFNEMKFFPDYKRLILLQTNNYPNNQENSVFYNLEPYNNIPYNALVTYNTNAFYFSLDRFSKKEFLATGELKMLSHAFLTHDILSTPQFQCLEGDYIPIDNTMTPTHINKATVLFYINTAQLSSFKTAIQTLYKTNQCND